MKSILFIVTAFTFCSVQAQEVQDYSFQIETSFLSGKKVLSDEAHYNLSSELLGQVQVYRDIISSSGQTVQGYEVSVKQVVIKSRTDSKGSAETNLKISEERAMAVKQDVQVLFINDGVPYQPEAFTALGLGEPPESEANMCSYKENVCGYSPDDGSQANLPPRQRSQLMFELFGDDDDEVYEDSEEQDYIPPREIGNDDEVWMDPNQTQDLFNQNSQNSEQIYQCKEVVRWNQDCLDSQRITTIEVTLQYAEKHKPEPLPQLDPLPTVIVQDLPPLKPVEKPATQEDVVQPPTEDETQPLPKPEPLVVPSDEKKDDEPVVTPPATPAGPNKLKVYGQPVTN